MAEISTYGVGFRGTTSRLDQLRHLGRRLANPLDVRSVRQGESWAGIGRLLALRAPISDVARIAGTLAAYVHILYPKNPVHQGKAVGRIIKMLSDIRVEDKRLSEWMVANILGETASHLYPGEQERADLFIIIATGRYGVITIADVARKRYPDNPEAQKALLIKALRDSAPGRTMFGERDDGKAIASSLTQAKEYLERKTKAIIVMPELAPEVFRGVDEVEGKFAPPFEAWIRYATELHPFNRRARVEEVAGIIARSGHCCEANVRAAVELMFPEKTVEREALLTMALDELHAPRNLGELPTFVRGLFTRGDYKGAVEALAELLITSNGYDGIGDEERARLVAKALEALSSLREPLLATRIQVASDLVTKLQQRGAKISEEMVIGELLILED